MDVGGGCLGWYLVAVYGERFDADQPIRAYVIAIVLGTCAGFLVDREYGRR